MEKIYNLYKKYQTKSRIELLFAARRALELLLPHFRNLTGSEEDALTVLVAFIAASVASDGQFTDKEIGFVSEVMHLSPEQAHHILTRAATPAKREAVNGLFDSCDPGEKLLLIEFCMCFLAADGDIGRAENEFITKLIE